MAPDYELAWEDLRSGFMNWPIWSRLGFLEIRRRYRRTVLGPFWTSAQLAVTVFAMGYLWAALFNQPVSEYFPFLTAGIITWALISSFLTEGSGIFLDAQGLLTSMYISRTLLVMIVIWRNLLVFLHNILVYALVVYLTGVPLNLNTLLIIPGIIIVLINGFWISLIIGLVSTRLRDVRQLVVSFLQILMFITPVVWSKDALKGRVRLTFMIELNPFYHLTELVRSPLMGQAPGILSWLFCIMMIVVGCTITFHLFSRFRQRIPYWL